MQVARSDRPHRHPCVVREQEVYFVEDVQKILQIGVSKAYSLMRRINKELEAEGFITVPGRVSKARFNEKIYVGKGGANAITGARPKKPAVR
jgi:hypothetical protein